MSSTPTSGRSARRPQLSGDALAVIGLAVGALLARATTGAWTVPAALLGVALAVGVIDLLRVALPIEAVRRLRAGWMVVIDLDAFGLGILVGAWAAAGASLWIAVLLAALGVLVAVLGYVFRPQVLTAFMIPGSSPVGIVLAVVPLLGGGASGILLVRIAEGSAVPAAVMAVAALYVLLFAQSAALRVQVPGWEPPAATRRRNQPRSRQR